MFDLENRCDLCDKPLFVTSPVRTRCDQCVRYGPPEEITLKIREFGTKEDATRSPCAGCGRTALEDGVTPIALADGYCLGCRLDGAQTQVG